MAARMSRLLRALLWPFKCLAALLILFEEWGWEPLQRVLARIARWPGFRWLDAAIRRLPPYAALALLRATLNKSLAARASRDRAVCRVAKPRRATRPVCVLRLASHPNLGRTHPL